MATATVTIPGGTVVDTYSLSELFGVAWPDQPIEFRYLGTFPLPATTTHDWAAGRGGGFPVGIVSVLRGYHCAARLYRGAKQSAGHCQLHLDAVVGWAPSRPRQTNPVQINPVGNNLEITNGLTGVRIACTAANVMRVGQRQSEFQSGTDPGHLLCAEFMPRSQLLDGRGARPCFCRRLWPPTGTWANRQIRR